MPLVARDVRSAIMDETLARMTEEPLHRIRVTSLCKSAGVNRSTFYEYFQDLYAVAAQIEETFFAELDALIVSVREGKLISSYAVSAAFLEFFAQNRLTARALLSNETASSVMQQLDERIMELFADAVLKERPDLRTIPDEVLRFAAAGYYRFYMDVALAEDAPDKTKIGQLAAIMTDFCEAGLERCLSQGE